ncbi:MAG: hypothetical protein EOM03_14930 [Clostridia bacterium]|jgi:hypothetical protein|nr:hypothetical protein [Clostridia bacterium]
MIDDRTPYLDLPLPHPDNLLTDDVLRLREALVAVDTGFGQQRAEVQATMVQTRSEVNTALDATTTAVGDTLDEVSADLTGQLRRLRLNQLLNLNLY